MKIYVIGIRGFPNIQGGAEKRCEQLFIRLVKFGLDVTVFVRRRYFLKNKKFSEWEGIKFLYLYAPKKNELEAFVHSFLASLYSLVKKANIVHFQNMGPAFFIPLVKIFGVKKTHISKV